jgi:hypothetical protein
VAKLLLILILGGALANSLGASSSQAPLLIDAHPAPTHVALDASN